MTDTAMRLIVFTPEFPPRLGGIQQMTYQLVQQFCQLGHEVMVVTLRQPGDAAFDEQQPFMTRRIEWEVPGSPSVLENSLHKVKLFGNYRQQIIRFQANAILCTHWDPSGYVTALATIGLAVPFFIVAHGTELNTISARRAAYRIKRALQHFTLTRATRIFAVSRFTAEKVRALGIVTEKIRVIPNGVEAGGPVGRHRETIESPRLLTVCRLVPRKGCDTVIRALPNLLTKYPALTYTIVGDGPEKTHLQTLVRSLSLEQYVIFAGQIDHKDKGTLYLTSDIFVMPARQTSNDFEGFGLVFLEAMAHGLPVVGASTGGIPDVIEANVTGLLVPPDDPVALAEALHRLLADFELRASLAKAALQRVNERFLWSTVAQQYVEQMIAATK